MHTNVPHVGDVILDAFEQDCVPGRAEYALLAPDGIAGPVPLMLLLHGGESSRQFLETMRPLIVSCWERGDLPACVIATPSAHASFYMDYRDGSQRWETLISQRLPTHVARTHPSVDLGRIVICGVSMGASGALRMALKSPERFKAVAALEPGIEQAFSFADIPLRDRFWRDPRTYEDIFGRPVDEAFWQTNSIANLARDHAERVRTSGLAIYLEAGSEDSMLLHHGAEFLHRTLWDRNVKHEYRHVLGADHVGASLPDRFRDAFRFLHKVVAPPPPDPALAPFHAWVEAMKVRAGYAG